MIDGAVTELTVVLILEFVVFKSTGRNLCDEYG